MSDSLKIIPTLHKDGISLRSFLFRAAFGMLACLSLCSCQLLDNDAYQDKRAFDLLKQKNYDKAAEIFQHTVQHREKTYQEVKSATPAPSSSAVEKSEGKKLASAYFNLALVLFESGKYGQSEDILESAVATYSAYFGKNNIFIADAIGMLANAYFKQGKLLEAERYFEEELEIKKTLLKPGSLELAVIANNLASVYQKLGDDAEAEKYFHWALNLCENCKKSEQELDQLADILNNLAVFYQKQEFYSDAREKVEQAIEIENSHTGTLFIVDKVRSLLVLALIEKSTFNLDDSESHYQEALKLIDDSLKDRKDLLAEALDKYAGLLYSERKYEEAEPIFVRCLKAMEEAHGVNHPSVASVLSEFSQIYKRTDRDAKAEELLKRAITIQENTIGIDTADYLATVHRLATVYADQNKLAEADKLYQEILPKLKARIGPDHPFVADSYDNWAGFMERSGARDKGKELRARAHLIRRKIAHSLNSSSN